MPPARGTWRLEAKYLLDTRASNARSTLVELCCDELALLELNSLLGAPLVIAPRNPSPQNLHIPYGSPTPARPSPFNSYGHTKCMK